MSIPPPFSFSFRFRFRSATSHTKPTERTAREKRMHRQGGRGGTPARGWRKGCSTRIKTNTFSNTLRYSNPIPQNTNTARSSTANSNPILSSLRGVAHSGQWQQQRCGHTKIALWLDSTRVYCVHGKVITHGVSVAVRGAQGQCVDITSGDHPTVWSTARVFLCVVYNAQASVSSLESRYLRHPPPRPA